jgi:NADPH:quinone reductase-like Zn-dependent oxidoreductase
MKAVRIHEFGGREALQLESVPKPTPSLGEALVKVHAAGVNPIDWKTREGVGLDVELPYTLGWDLSGTVEAVGDSVSSVSVGDDVIAMVPEWGTYAEYVAVPVATLIPKPSSLSHIDAAGAPLVGLTAWQALFDEAELRPGQRVLVHAAAGGVGHLAVQLANWNGAYTIGTASDANRGYLDQLGLDEFVNYRDEAFESVVDQVDVVVDAVGNDVTVRSSETLNSGGHITKLTAPVSDEESRRVMAADGSLSYLLVQRRTEQLRTLALLLETGDLKIRVDSVFPLEEVDAAHERSESGHPKGKVILDVTSAKNI